MRPSGSVYIGIWVIPEGPPISILLNVTLACGLRMYLTRLAAMLSVPVVVLLAFMVICP